MANLSTGEMVERLQQSLNKLLGWAEHYAPGMVEERRRYDADLDEAEDLLEATEAWIEANAGQWLRRNAR